MGIEDYRQIHKVKGDGSMKPKELSNETLAAILRAMCSTGICPTQYEKDYLIEAARRLEMKGEESEKDER